MVQMKNKIAMVLMETGVNYNKQRLHRQATSANCWLRTRTSMFASASVSILRLERGRKRSGHPLSAIRS